MDRNVAKFSDSIGNEPERCGTLRINKGMNRNVTELFDPMENRPECWEMPI